MKPNGSLTSRREWLTILGVAASTSIAGCPSSGPNSPSGTGSSPPPSPERTDTPPVTDTPTTTPSKQAGSLTELTVEEFPYFPENTFIVTTKGNPYIGPFANDGYAPVSRHEARRTLGGLHPDFLDFRDLSNFRRGRLWTKTHVAAGLHYSLRTGIPASAGWNFLITTNREDLQSHIGAFMERQEWTLPNGEPLSHPLEIRAEPFGGAESDNRLAAPSVFAPGTFDLVYEMTTERIQQGFAGMLLDCIPYGHEGQLDFSVWARTAFTDHLTSLSDERLTALEVDNPEEVDIESYLNQQGLTPDDERDPRTDGMFREYTIHIHNGLRRLLRRYRDSLEEAHPESIGLGGFAIWGNQAINSPLRPPQSSSIYVSEYFDVINTENWPTVEPAADYVYKITEALGEFQKPAQAEGTMFKARPEEFEGFDSDQRYPMLQRFQLAESIANGVDRKLTLAGDPPSREIDYLIRQDGTISPELQNFVDFLWAHERHLHDTDPANHVALIWSLPDRLWNYFPEWDIGNHGRQRGVLSFRGAATLLRENQFPYDVLVFGHPRLWDDGKLLERLDRYEAVILPGIECISDEQLSALGDLIDTGGSLVVSGEPPDRTAMYEQRPLTPDIFEDDRTTILEEDPGLQRMDQGETIGSLVETLDEAGVKPLVEATEPTLAVSRRVKGPPRKEIVHLLNYDYDRSTDTFASKRDFELRLPDPDGALTAVRYYSPEGVEVLKPTWNGATVKVTVPLLREWGFVVFASDTSVITSSVDTETAKARFQAAQERIEEARSDGEDWSTAFTNAEVHLSEAETALNYGANALAETTSNLAISAANRSYPQPTVAIDLAHGQEGTLPGSGQSAGPLGSIRDTYPEYDWRLLSEWGSEPLVEVDLLIVPPTLTGQPLEFDDESHLESVEAFVRSGGSLFIAGGGQAGSFGELGEQLNFKFGTDPIVGETFHETMAYDLDHQHELTLGVPAIAAEGGSPIEEYPDDATVLTRFEEDANAWIHEQPPREEKSSGEASVSGRPVYAGFSLGNGRVVLLGNHRYLTDFESYIRFYSREVIENILEILGRAAVHTD